MIPSHIGLEGNEKVNKTAKRSLYFNQTVNFQIQHLDIQYKIFKK